MKDFFRSTAHLSRVVLLLVIGLVVFLVIRRAIVPAGFGAMGHYRPASLDDVSSKPIKFAGREACETCHSDQVEAKNKGEHAHVACEACHGPLAKHAEDPTSLVPQLPDIADYVRVATKPIPPNRRIFRR